MLTLTPCSLREANAYIALYHRHHQPVQGAKFALAVADALGGIRGVATVGRPVARLADDGWTLEVTRCCTDGSRNACSMLYGAAWRVGKAMGYRRMQTYVLLSEPGTSLRAAGWRYLHRSHGRGWDHAARTRADRHPLGPKACWGIGDWPAFLDGLAEAVYTAPQ